MATEKTIGDAASGADYAASSNAINLWEAGQDGESGDQTGILITDVLGSYVSFSGWAAVAILLKSDSTRRTYKSNANERLFRLEDTDPTYNFEGFDCDFNTYGSSYGCIFSNLSGSTMIAKRMRFTGNTAGQGVITPGTATWSFDSCIFDNNSSYGATVITGTVTTFKNCGSFKNGDIGFRSANNNVAAWWNCISMNNTTEDFDTGHTQLGDYNISGDWTASNDFTNYLNNKSSYTSYFTDWANDNFHLKADDPWGAIGYNATNQSALDFDGAAWVNNNLGAFDFASDDIISDYKAYSRGYSRGFSRGFQ